MAILDGSHLKKEIKNNKEIIDDYENEISRLIEDSKTLDQEYDQLNKEYGHIFSKCQAKDKEFKVVNSNKHKLEKSILKAESRLKKIESSINNTSSNSSVISNGATSTSSSNKNHKVIFFSNTKHTGNFTFNQANKIICWSCCLSHDKNGFKH